MTTEEFCKKLIGGASMGLERLTPVIETVSDDTNKQQKKSNEVFCEFMFVLIHMVDRTIFAELGQKARDNAMDDIAKLSLRQSVEKLYRTLDENGKKTITTILQIDLNDTHCAYSNCDSIAAKDHRVFTSNSISSKFARRISKVLDSSLNPEIIRQAIVLFALVSKELDLPNQVRKLSM